MPTQFKDHSIRETTKETLQVKTNNDTHLKSKRRPIKVMMQVLMTSFNLWIDRRPRCLRSKVGTGSRRAGLLSTSPSYCLGSVWTKSIDIHLKRGNSRIMGTSKSPWIKNSSISLSMPSDLIASMITISLRAKGRGRLMSRDRQILAQLIMIGRWAWRKPVRTRVEQSCSQSKVQRLQT